MRPRWGVAGIVVVWVLVVALAAVASAGLAQEIRADYDEFGNRTLSVDGWRLILPRMFDDPVTGELWLDWQYPDGTGRGFGAPLDDYLRMRGLDGSSPHHLMMWFREGDFPPEDHRPSSYFLPGYDLEYTEALIAWWEQGNDGCYELEAGAWVAIDCGDPEPTAARDPAAAPAGDSPACQPGMSPFEAAAAGCRITPHGMAPSGDTLRPEVQEAAETLRAAQELCQLNPTVENCAARDRAYAAYIDLMGGEP